MKTSITNHSKIKINEITFNSLTREKEVARFNISMNYSLHVKNVKHQEIYMDHVNLCVQVCGYNAYLLMQTC